MVGYEIIHNWWIPYMWGGVAMVGLEVLVAMGLIAKEKGTDIMNYWCDDGKMWVRRYRVVEGKLETYFTQIDIPIGISKYSATTDAYAPPGTKAIYLQEKTEWGFTESVPPAPCVVFMSPGMEPIVDKILKECAEKP